LDVGGLVGLNQEDGSIVSSFWDVNSSGWMTSDGGEGKTTAQMKTLSTFTSAGWDFTNETANGTNDYWRMCTNGIDYPRLNWESTSGDLACPDGVAMEDMVSFAERWASTDCDASNNYCAGADINGDGIVNMLDFALMAKNWMQEI
jgi:hypothetical protein